MGVVDPEVFDGVLAAAREGDVPALGEIYRAFQPSLVRYLRANAQDAADDLASETWIDVAAGLHRFSGGMDDFRRWVFTIARRRLLDDRRKVLRRRTHPADAAILERDDPSADTQAEALGRIDSEKALRRIAELPQEQAEVVLLRVVAGLSADDVASILGKTPGNIRVIQHRALTQLARQTTQVKR
jgi:RNA polymerase sigma-70 factor, ECF subfamily